MIHLKKEDVKPTVEVKVPGGVLLAYAAHDLDYPGIWVEFLPDKPGKDMLSNPAVLVEWPCPQDANSTLRAVVWGDGKQEDYTDEIKFQNFR